jgi:hypothetical protein
MKTRSVLGPLALSVLGALLLITLVTWPLRTGGDLVVQMQESGPGGCRVSIRIPAFLLDLGLRMVPLEPIRAGLDAQAMEILRLAARLGDRLRRVQDALFVEVRSAEESLRILKRDGRLVIEAREPDSCLYVEIPLGSLARVGSRIAGERRHPWS